jgi:hypothetical protein
MSLLITIGNPRVCTFHVVVIAQIMDGKRTSDSYWKIMDLDGDIIVAEVHVVGPEKR